MAEAGTQIQPTQGTPGQAPAAGASNPASTQGQDPAWMTHVPEQFRDEAKKSYLLQSDYTKKTQELADQRKSWEGEQQKYKEYETKVGNYDKWWNENSKTIELLQKNWEKVQPILMGQAAPSQNEQPSHFKDYDILPPEEQGKRVAEYVQNQYMTQALAAQEQKYAQALAEKQSQVQNYLAIVTDAFERKAADPSLNIRDYIQKATEIASGKFNPMEMAYHTLTDPQKLEKQKAEWWAQAKEEGMLEERNKHQSPGAFQGSGVPNFRVKPQSKEDIRTAIQKLSMDKGFGWGT